MCQLQGRCAILNLMCCVKTFSSVLKKSVSPLTVGSLMIFRKVTAFYFRHNKKHLDKFSAHVAAIFNATSHSRYINYKNLPFSCNNDISAYTLPLKFHGVRWWDFKF